MSLHQLGTDRSDAWRNQNAASMAGQHGHALDYQDSANELTTRIRSAMAQNAQALSEARCEALTVNRLTFDAGDVQICGWARRWAGEAGSRIDAAADTIDAVQIAIDACRIAGIDAPEFDPDTDPLPNLRRVACAKWWRKRGRVMVARRVELAAIKAGQVCRARHVYVSEPGMERARESRNRNRELLEGLEAVNEAGDSYTLAELSDLSTANPVLRRNELMTRIGGLEEISETRGDRGLFVTVTAPTRFHAVTTATNRRNPAWDGSTARDAQQWLCEGWRRVRARLHKLGIKLYGLRCVEPHHDETPHWHLLLFAASRLHQVIRKALFDVFLAELPADPKAAADRIRHGVKVKTIRRDKGSATGYIAKYLAKNIDGHQLTMTWERGADGSMNLSSREPATAAERIRAWASTWGLRQFQFMGTPAVTVWRELRRVSEAQDSPIIENARLAADAGDYALHVQHIGGVCKPRRLTALVTLREPLFDSEGAIRLSAYGEPMADAITGVVVNIPNGATVTSRNHLWEVGRAAASCGPWTRVNNCNHPPPPRDQLEEDYLQ